MKVEILKFVEKPDSSHNERALVKTFENRNMKATSPALE